MPRLDDTDHTQILDTRYRYGRVEGIDRVDDLLTVRLLDGTLQPTQTVLEVPAYYHCVPDAAPRGNGALEGGARAFALNDTAILQVQGDAYLAVGIKDRIRSCGLAAALFVRRSDEAPYEYLMASRVTGKPWSQNVVFSDFWEWGSADGLWYYAAGSVTSRYWVLDEGRMRRCVNEYVDRYPRRADLEQDCTGLPEDIITFSVRRNPTSGLFFMLVSRPHPDGEVVDKYQSADGLAWTFVATVFSANYQEETQLYSDKAAVSSGLWLAWPPRRPYFIEWVEKASVPGHPSGYYQSYVRLWRIGIYERWDEYGNQNTQEKGYTAWAANDGMAAWYFQFEGEFELDGQAAEDLDLVQMVRSIY